MYVQTATARIDNFHRATPFHRAASDASKKRKSPTRALRNFMEATIRCASQRPSHQPGGHSACEGEGDDQTGGDTDSREAQSLPHYELEDLARPGTEGHANTNFGGALAHDRRKPTVKPYAREQCGDDREYSDQ